MENAWWLIKPWQVQPWHNLKQPKPSQEEGDLSNVCRLAAHVWSGDDLKPGLSPCHAAVVLDEVDPLLSLNTGVPAPHQLQLPLIRR